MFFINGTTDDRSIVTQETFDYFDSIVAVDRLNKNSQLYSGGSGVLIDAQFVLTAAHVVFAPVDSNPNDPSDRNTPSAPKTPNLQSSPGARISFADDVPNVDPIRAVSSLTFVTKDTVDYEINTENGRTRVLPGNNILFNGVNNIFRDYDFGLLNLAEDTSNSSDSVEPLGIVAFVNPEDAVGLNVFTAGYPGSFNTADEDISKNAQFIFKDDNGNTFLDNDKNFSTISTVMFRADGSITGIENENFKKDFVLSETVDAEPGQSGSGILTFLDGNPNLITPDSEPRVAGVLSFVSKNENENKVITAAIDKPVYDNIVAEIGRVQGTENGNDLPENAIIGKNANLSNADDIVGTYRRERILGLGGDDVLEGMGGNDRLEGGEGDDILEGGSGDDRLTGGAGDDQLNGGSDGVIGIGIPGLPGELLPGGDIAIFSGNSSEYEIERSGILGTTLTITHKNDGIDGKDTLTGIEYVQFQDTVRAFPFAEDDTVDNPNNPNPDEQINFTGGSGNDNLIGNISNNLLLGNGGSDRLEGNEGDDTLKGNDGNDSLSGGDDNDLLQGGDGNDNLNGNGGSDRIFGDLGNDLIKGGTGNDYLSGSNGLDTLKGEGGNDYVTGGNDKDLLQGGDGNDNLNGDGGGDRIFGDLGNDLIQGGTGNDYLSGGSGFDTLTGGFGRDTLAGGFGQDSFLFEGVDQLVDEITDFSVEDDTLLFTASNFAGVSNLGIISPEIFTIGASANDSSDRFIYHAGSGDLFYDLDGTGSGQQVKLVKLDAELSLTSSNFELI